ncbi:hypothetical protein [Acidovorax sp.]|uniref:hypothetical protein n=1 Tax=Acidovorax sp. TaxID=1872122 RepID=UPI002ACEC437|nr:hypothetical protein [Acidovorax sp.]MDZ7866781.1 hypothetical protein [Acidovorax sp.]
MSGSKSSDASFAHAASQAPEQHRSNGGAHPLGLTVHSLPEAGDAVASSQRTRHGRLKMFGVLLICAAPVIASYFTYYVIRPEGRRVYGELINPQRPMPELVGTALDGKPASLASLKGQWLLVSVAGGDCNEPCQKHLYLQRQLRETLGREKDRVEWVWLVNDAALPPPLLAPALQQATVLRLPPEGVAAWLAPAQGQALPDHLYVVDPMGNWMMRFPAAMDSSGAAKAKRDLDRLLRASSSWDEAGRPAKP